MSDDTTGQPMPCEVISEFNCHDSSTQDYSSLGTLRATNRHNSTSSLNDNKAVPMVLFVDPCEITSSIPPVTVAPARPTNEDEIVASPIDIATQTEDLAHEGEDPANDTTRLQENKQPEERADSCGMVCLYCVIDCCECCIM